MFLVTTLFVGLTVIAGCGGSDTTSTGGASNLNMVSGTVIDASGSPVEGATVVIGENSPHAMTDSNGAFTIFDVPPGDHQLHVISDGFY
ncbi:MAG: carboxypeptidase-like regulatory domain-containing protein, partial [Thermodesulfobacteriota bacterium]